MEETKMASVTIKQNCQYFIACITLEDGTRTQRSTRITDRKDAQRFAEDLEEASRKRKTEGQMRRVLSDIHDRLYGCELPSATLVNYVDRWLKQKEGTIKSVSLPTYTGPANEFVEFLGTKASLQIQYITKADVVLWRDSVAAKVSARTANNKLKIIRQLFESAWRDGLITDNPAAKVETLKNDESNRRPFTEQELRRILAVANDEWRGMILAGVYTGQRLKDIALLTWSNVDQANNEIVLTTSKTGRRQFIPIAEPLKKYIFSLPVSDDVAAPLFPKAHRIATNNKSTSTLSQQFYEILVSAGLAEKRAPKNTSTGVGRDGKRETSGLMFHSLRHTATSLLKNGGVSEIVARDIIGHQSQAVSLQYSHVDRASKHRAIAALPDITT